MSTARFVTSYDSKILGLLNHHRSQASVLNIYCHLGIPRSKNGRSFLANQASLSLSISHKVQSITDSKIDTTVRNSVQPGAQPPSGGPSNSWRNWILGMLLSVILPFWKNKWGPLLALKREVETVVDAVECVVDVVEKVAEEVEKVADEVGDKLPEGTMLKDAANFVENLAKKAGEDAQLAEDFVHKVEEVEKEVEKEVETFMNTDNAETVEKEVETVMNTDNAETVAKEAKEGSA